MRLSIIFAFGITFITAAALCVFAAWISAHVIEDTSRKAVIRELQLKGLDWADVDTNGLQVLLSGVSPTEATRFQALTAAGSVVDATRIIDQMLVEDAADIAPPHFSIEILRNDSGLSLIGLIPAEADRQGFLESIAAATNEAPLTDLMEQADYPMPDTWNSVMRYAITILEILPRTKISMDAARVEITALAESTDHKQNVESSLAQSAPDDIRLAMNISAPRPVITPFTLRFLIEDGRPSFDACSADTEKARSRILSAAASAGLEGKADCTIGLGSPSVQWDKAAALSIVALKKLGDGSLTMSDGEIAIAVKPGVDEQNFDVVIGQLENTLPDEFRLKAVLPPALEGEEIAQPEFVATLSPEGLVRMSGRIDSDLSRETVTSFAQARFDSASVTMTARVAEELPSEWPLRVLSGIEALSYMTNGVVRVTPQDLTISGNSHDATAISNISQFLTDKLGAEEQFTIDIDTIVKVEPTAKSRAPQECEADIAQILSGKKITFDPGSANIGNDGVKVVDEISDILTHCGEIEMEISGHTDSQGGEEMNQNLSRQRALAVLRQLQTNLDLEAKLSAVGYGEAQPIADNDSEEGREVNRRIEFRLISAPVEDTQTSLEELETSNEESASDVQN